MMTLPENAPDWVVAMHDRLVTLENEMAKVNPRYSADLNAARQKWDDDHPEKPEGEADPEPIDEAPNPAPNPLAPTTY
jgi:hypothetical protein